MSTERLVCRDDHVCSARVAEAGGVMESVMGPVTYMPGDWLVRDCNNIVTLYHAAEFSERFVRIEVKESPK